MLTFTAMTRRFLLFCLLLGSFRVAAQDMNRVKATIDTLASPAMHGRGYVQQGDRKAAEFLRQQFREIGLKSFGKDYFQSFTLPINTFPGRVRLQAGRDKLNPGEEYIVNPVSQAGRGRGKVVYVDTLIFTQEAARQQFLTQNFKKKTVVYQAKHYSRFVELPTEYLDKLHEAKVLIELQPAKLTASLSNKQLTHPSFEVLQSAWKLATKRVRFRLDAQLIPAYPSQNVIGYLPGKTKPDSFLVISAHYDHLGRMGRETYFPGANDNASGTTMLLELARHYAANPPEYSVVFMAFGAEEAGLVGSAYYVKYPLFALEQIKLLINLDLVGTGDEGMTVVNATALKPEFELLTKINQRNSYLPQINKRANAPNSDHYFFTLKGVPAMFWYTLGGIKAYHDVYDRAETLPLTKFSSVFHLITDFTEEL